MHDPSPILVVDDLAEKRLAYTAVLEDLGQVATAESGQDTLRQVLERDFAVVLLDVNMPDMDGYETAALLRRRPRSANTPIIFITAFADDLQTSRGYELGAVDFLLAPVKPEILRTKVRVFVELFRATSQIARQAEIRIEAAHLQAARAAAEKAAARSELLLRASKALTETLDQEAAIQRFLRVAIPEIADLGMVTLLPTSSTVGMPLEYMHAEAAGQTPATKLLGRHKTLVASAQERVLTTGRRECLALARADNANGQGDIHSVALLPMVRQTGPLGVWTLARTLGRRGFSAEELLLAEELADRAAIAIHNAQLFRDLAESNRNKNEFLSVLAHELRNPLAPIVSGAKILRLHGAATTEVATVQEMIERQATHLVRLVDDLLDVARISHGKLALRTERLDLLTVVHHAVELSRPLIAARGHELNVTVPEGPVPLQADPVRIAQAISNLLNNAARYTPKAGTIHLEVSTSPSHAVIQVRDSGIGIPPEMLSSIFKLFAQLENRSEHHQGGLGIGLMLVRSLVDMHGGSVEAESPGVGLGSTFTIRLPLAPPLTPKIEVEPRAETTSSRAAPGRRILVVDDNVDAADSLAMLLEMLGHHVTVANDGHTAIRLTQDATPEFILMDIGMPHMDGREAARRIRALPRGEDCYLIAVTGWGQEGDKQSAYDAGFDAHMTKPAEIDTLRALLRDARRPAEAVPR